EGHSKRLSIRSRRDGSDSVLIEIRDNGIGLEDVDGIFEPFFSTKRHGMGMGLAICRSIVEAHQGRLWATNNRPRGATFKIKLPIATSGSR
ncbi:MAG TPA: ATP-binding protein, partial [Gemmatimonadales bacterium]|nr:ATP-binding protein [Gemmatimonadales bacterium]